MKRTPHHIGVYPNKKKKKKRKKEREEREREKKRRNGTFVSVFNENCTTLKLVLTTHGTRDIGNYDVAAHAVESDAATAGGGSGGGVALREE